MEILPGIFKKITLVLFNRSSIDAWLGYTLIFVSH